MGGAIAQEGNIQCDGVTLQDRIDQILACFELDDSQPNLRTEWVVLQLTTFNHGDYNRLAAFEDEMCPPHGQDAQSTAATIQQNILELGEKKLLDPNPEYDGVNFVAAEANGLTARIIEKCEADQMFGKPYETVVGRKELQIYLVKLTLHISDSFPLISVPTQPEIDRAFNTIYAIFTRHNEKVRENKKAERRQKHAKQREIDSIFNPGLSSATSSTFSLSSASASQKRRQIGGDPQPTKRPKIVPRTSIPQVMLKLWEKNVDGSLVEEPNGSMIIVDTTGSGSEEPEVKHDVNEIEEDLYDVTPAPRGSKTKKAVDV